MRYFVLRESDGQLMGNFIGQTTLGIVHDILTALKSHMSNVDAMTEMLERGHEVFIKHAGERYKVMREPSKYLVILANGDTFWEGNKESWAYAALFKASDEGFTDLHMAIDPR